MAKLVCSLSAFSFYNSFQFFNVLSYPLYSQKKQENHFIGFCACPEFVMEINTHQERELACLKTCNTHYCAEELYITQFRNVRYLARNTEETRQIWLISF